MRKTSPPSGFDAYGKVNESKAKYLNLTCHAGTGKEQVFEASSVPRNFVRGEGVSTNSVEDRGQTERGSGGGSPLVRGFEGSCNLVQEISFHTVKFY